MVALLFAVSGFADTFYDNFTGYNQGWYPFGNPNTATYGETFSVPTNDDLSLESIGFYMGGPQVDGDIVLSAYIATWTGTNAGNLLFSSAWVDYPADYPNTGDAELTFDTSALYRLAPGEELVAFLSVSQYYGQSVGESYISVGTPTIPGGNFVFCNNGGDFAELFNSPWSDTGAKPDWAFTADFTTPEPGTVMLLGAGLLGLVGLRRKLSF